MVIIISELILIMLIARNLRNKGLHSIYRYLCLAFLVQAFILIVYRLELASIGRNVYYSDAEVYWNATLSLLYGNPVRTWNMGYVYYCYIIQITSPFIWVGFINISNILLIDITILIFSYLMVNSQVPMKNAQFFILVCTLNPLIIYALGRNLKDVLFLFYTMLTLVIFHWLKTKRTKRITRGVLYCLIVILAVLLTDVRPWGFLVSIAALFASVSEVLAYHFRKSPVRFGVTCIFIMVSLPPIAILMKQRGFLSHLDLWIPIVLENARSQSWSRLLLAPMRILTGPGPLRSVLGNEYFLFYTVSGNVFSAIGAFMWWIVLGILVANLLVGNKQLNHLSKMLLLIFGLFMIVYSMQYGGSLELRFRGIVYILTSGLVLSLVPRRSDNRVRSLAIIMMFVIFAGGLWFS